MPLSSSPNLGLGMASGSQVGGGRLRESEHWKRIPIWNRDGWGGSHGPLGEDKEGCRDGLKGVCRDGMCAEE